MLGGKDKCFTIKGEHKQNNSIVYVKVTDDNCDINIIPIEKDLEIRKIALFSEYPVNALEIAKEKFKDYNFDIVIADYEFKISTTDCITSCYGCLFEGKSAYSCFGCNETVNDVIAKKHYVKKQ